MRTEQPDDAAAITSASKSPRRSDHVYSELLHDILYHRYAPGERVSVPVIARELKVSQMPVRQAIDRLSEEGLVEVRPRSGTYVAKADEREIAESFDIRRVLDRLAAETAVIHVEERDLAELEGMVDQMDEYAALGLEGVGPHDLINWQFHLRIVRLARNEKLYDMYRQLNAHLQIASAHASSRDWVARVGEAQREHRAMVEALRDRSADALADVLEVHVERGKAALIAEVRAARRPAPVPKARTTEKT